MKKYFNQKKVLITGNTGFKGSWLSMWMHHYGAKVLGVSNGIPTSPSNFSDLQLSNIISYKKTDIRNFKKIKKVIEKFQPDFIFHLAAQAIVKKSFEDPKTTWESNTLGTVNILESIKSLKKEIVVVIITSDKVYKNLELSRGYNETDKLGGLDPYSASKSSADLATQCYANLIFNKRNIKIGIARAGNVIGGGDWANNRVIPDCIRQWSVGRTVELRNPRSTRPWQHVLDVLNGYITLAIKLKYKKNLYGESFNFGPKVKSNMNVLKLVEQMKKTWKRGKWIIKKNNTIKESKLLQLNSIKAKSKLKWQCKLDFNKAVSFTANWYENYFLQKKNMLNYSIWQIKQFNKIK